MKQILKGIKIVVIVVCVVTMVRCLSQCNFRPIYNMINWDFYWNIFMDKREDERKIELSLRPALEAEMITVIYDGKRIECKEMLHSSIRDFAYYERFTRKEYSVSHNFAKYNGGIEEDWYTITMFGTKEIDVFSDMEFLMRLRIENFIPQLSHMKLEIIFPRALNEMKFELQKDALLIVSKYDLSDVEIRFDVDDKEKHYEYTDIGSETEDSINSILIKIIDSKCKVLIDLDKDGEFEFECK